MTRVRGLAGRLLHHWALRHCEQASQEISANDLPGPGPLDTRALPQRLGRTQRPAEAPLRKPVDVAIPRPAHSDWAWRPEAWRVPLDPPGLVSPPAHSRFGADLEVFHDASNPALVLRQIRSESGGGSAVLLETAGFNGSFLSLALTLPPEAAHGLRRRHVLRLVLDVQADGTAPEAFARLNLRHGPNTEQLTRRLSLDDAGTGGIEIDFDLAHTRINEARVDRLWLDLILVRPTSCRTVVHDLTLSRRPRADF